jgi:hypothetical protein
MNFETLVNEFINDHGIGGGGPLATLTGQTEAVVGQSGDLARAVRWIRDANDEINSLWHDWKFLWNEWTGALATGSQTPTLPSAFAFNLYDRNSFMLNKGTSTVRLLRFVDFDIFRPQYDAIAPTTGSPIIITELPNRTLKVDTKASVDYTFYCAGWKKPTQLAIDASTPDIPVHLQRIIIARAGIFYANLVDAPEVLEGCEAEYMDLLDKLQSSELESFRYERLSAQDLPLSINVPDEVSGYPQR